MSAPASRMERREAATGGAMVVVGALIRVGSDTPKLASAWLGCSHEREREEALPLAHARGYVGDDEDGRNLAPKLFG